MTADAEAGYGLRKRRKLQQPSHSGEDSLERLLEVAAVSQKIVVFSGSGLSAASGMSTFSTRGGLYDRAARKYKLADGKMLFTYSFFDRQRPEAQAFFADIYSEALSAEPAAGHHALRQLHDAGRLLRHYTLNIDGLAEQVGMGSWHHEHNPEGVTVEMHGNVRFLVCPECHGTLPMTTALAKKIRAKQPVPCPAPGCGHGAMRFKVMMYDDGEAECITPDDVMELMEADVKAADLVLWVGISFQQSASTVYFRKVRCWIQEAGRPGGAVQALVNPSDEALFNLRTAMSNQAELRVLEVLAESDEALPLLAGRVRHGPAAGGAASGGVAPGDLLGSRERRQPRRRQQRYREEWSSGEAESEEDGGGRSTRQLRRSRSTPAIKQEVAAAAAAGQQAAGLLPGQLPPQAQAQPPAPDALQRAVGFAGAGGAQAGWQQQQAVTIQSLEVLQQALLKAVQLTAGGNWQAAVAAQQQLQERQAAQLAAQQQQQQQIEQHLARQQQLAQQQQLVQQFAQQAVQQQPAQQQSEQQQQQQQVQPLQALQVLAQAFSSMQQVMAPVPALQQLLQPLPLLQAPAAPPIATSIAAVTAAAAAPAPKQPQSPRAVVVKSQDLDSRDSEINMPPTVAMVAAADPAVPQPPA